MSSNSGAMIRVKAYFSYDGTAYHGLQRQKNTPHTIQEQLEKIFSMISSQRITLVASGRTDAGVHARIQVAHVNLPERVVERHFKEKLSSPSLVAAMNSLLPKDIRVHLLERVPVSFHANRDVLKKTYVYFIDTSPVQNPALRAYAWHLKLPLNWQAMEQATKVVIGTHDFKSFCSSGSSVKTTVRTVNEAKWGTVELPFLAPEQAIRVFRITGKGFLRQMVRNIVGTLVHVGMNRSTPEAMADLLAQKKTATWVHAAPATGLWLWDILY